MDSDSKLLLKAAEDYFAAWNSKDLKKLENCFVAEKAVLRDWDISVEGTSKVVEANGNIFKAVPKIAIEVVKVHPCVCTCSASCEILVKLNNDKNEVLKVVDVIDFDKDYKIKALRAYKG
eukprot:jgi/Bigna1/88213/estExt_fgenesh1_pg.C_290085